MGRVDRFIELFNQLSGHLSKVAGCNDRMPFYELIDQAAQYNRTVARESVRLKKFGDLRNVVIHWLDYPREIIAEPSETTINQFEKIVSLIISPKKVSDYVKELYVFSIGDNLMDALKYMREKNFSQIVVNKEGEVALLTTEGIARWLEMQVERQAIIDADATVGDALAQDMPYNFKIVNRTATIDEVGTIFTRSIEQGYPRLFSVIITHSGKSTEKPIGIITPWDMIEKP